MAHVLPRWVLILTLTLVGVASGAGDARAQSQPLLPAIALRILPGVSGEMWPADFNGDGRPDIATSAGTVAILLGAGDGTFGAPVRSSTSGVVLAVADLNGDGRTDVVASIPGQGAVVLPGNGNGTLGSPRPILAGPLFAFASAADLDNDGHRDIVIGGVHDSDEGSRDVFVVPGNGDLTFDAAVALPPTTDNLPHGHIVADLDADGLRDIVLANREVVGLTVYLNQGALAFTTAPLETTLRSASDVTARDVTGDGRMDLLASVRSFGEFFQMWGEGAVEVFAGNGDGTFVSRGTFGTAPGAESVVVGDFTRDGRLDVATTNRSYWFTENFMCGASSHQDVDTLSILAGRGDGTFERHVSFALGDVVGPSAFQRIVGTVNTADVNGDGHTDLLVEPGRVLLNQAPRANRPPIVDAGADIATFDSELRLTGNATDPDHHWLKLNWTEGAPVPVGEEMRYRGAQACIHLPGKGEYTYSLAANDLHGGIASDSMTIRYPPHAAPTVTITQPASGAVVTEGTPFTVRWDVTSPDSISWFYLSLSTDGGANFTPVSGDCRVVDAARRECTWSNPAPPTAHARIRITIEDSFYAGTFDSALFTIRAGSDPLPAGWSNHDIGNVGAPGRVSIGSDTYTVVGSGADIWGTSDELHYLHRPVSGDFQIDVHVLSVENVDQWTKAGLMIRAGTAANAPHASLFATPTSAKGLAFQRRPAAGATSVHTAGDPRVAPVWLRLVRRGNTVAAYVRPVEHSSWELVGEQVFASLPHTVEAGLAVSSHADGTLAAASFDSLSIVEPAGNSWSNRDVGAVGAAGSATFDGTTHTVRGSGADIWGSADEFHYVHRTLTGDFQIEARVASVEHVDVWTKAGLMIREDIAAGSKHASLFVTPSTQKGIAFQRRGSTNGTSVHTAGPPLTAPVWLRLVRAGNTVTAFYRSSEQGGWNPMPQSQTFSSLAPTVQVGLAVSSHADGRLATAVFDHVRVFTVVPTDPGSPVGTTAFRTLDIGNVGVAGSARANTDGTFTVEGAGADIWGTADAFRFMYQALEGDWDIEARVNAVDGAHAWTKAGVMIRETLTPGSRHAFALVSAGKGVALQYRAATGGASSQAAQMAGTAPRIVRLTRRGDVFTAYARTDAGSWQTLGTATIPMAAAVYAGVAVTSHDAAALASGEFEAITVRRP